MATNKFFTPTENVNEQSLFNSLVVESIQINGVDVKYIKRTYGDIDNILGEVKSSIYKDMYEIEMYSNDYGQNVNENPVMTKFGFNLNDTSEFLVSITRWEETIYDPELLRPREGDLIYVGNSNTLHSSYMNTFYEIRSVRIGMPDKFQLGGVYCYRLTCDIFQPSHDVVQTDNTDIDDFLNNHIDPTQSNQFIEVEQGSVLVETKNPFGEM